MPRPDLRRLLRPAFPARAALWLIAVVAFAFSLAAFAVGLRLGSGETGQDEAREAVLVFAEFGGTADRVYTAPATNPGERTLIATVEHAEGWGINPAPAMAGTLVAYTVLSPETPGRRDEPAELWVLDVATHERTRLARDADLLAAPILDEEGGTLAYRSTGGDGEQRLVRVDLKTRARRDLHSYVGALGVYPVGFARDGALIFAELSNGGTDVYRVHEQAPARLLFHASDQIARDWQISPDGRALSYLAPEVAAERVVHRVQVVELTAGRERPFEEQADGAAEQFAPVWRPDGAVTVGREAYPATNASAVTLSPDGTAEALPAPAQGFDAPLAWSPDGRYLAARSFDGSSSYQPGRESMVVISVDGERRSVTARNELIFIGWMKRG